MSLPYVNAWCVMINVMVITDLGLTDDSVSYCRLKV